MRNKKIKNIHTVPGVSLAFFITFLNCFLGEIFSLFNVK